MNEVEWMLSFSNEMRGSDLRYSLYVHIRILINVQAI